MACSVETSQDGAGTLVVRVYQANAAITHRLPVHVWGQPFASCWLNMRLLADALDCPETPSHLVLAFGDPSDSVLLRWMGPEGVDSTYSYVFKLLDRYTLSRLPQIREQLPETMRQWVEQQIDLARQRQEAQVLLQIRTDVLYRIACILQYELTPTQEEIQRCVVQAKRLAAQTDYSKRDACLRSFDELTHLLALSAFARCCHRRWWIILSALVNACRAGFFFLQPSRKATSSCSSPSPSALRIDFAASAISRSP
jgi:hypothetical protein